MLRRVLPLRFPATTRIAMIVGLALLASACGPAPLAQYGVRRFYREWRGIRYDAFAAQPPAGGLSTYNRLAVERLENQMEDRIPAELVASLNAQLFEQLRLVKRLQVVPASQPDGASPVAPAFHNDGQIVHIGISGLGLLPRLATVPAEHRSSMRSVTTADRGGRTVILRGAILDFDGGKKSMRVLQVGVGRQAVLTLHLWLVDGATGEVVAKYVVNSEVYRLPADSSAVVSKLSKGVGELVAGLIEKSSPAPARVAARAAEEERH